MNETIELLRSHRSVRSFSPEPIPQDHIKAAITAGQAASTSSNIQAYCILRVTDAAARAELVELTGGQPQVAQCGAFLVVCGDTRRHRLLVEQAGHAYDARLEAFLLASIDASLFAQNMVVAFESQGYGVCYIGGLRNRLAAVDRLLDLPHGVYPWYGLCVGCAAETPAARPRLPLEAVFFEDRYPDDSHLLARLEAYDEEMRAWYRDRGGAPRTWSEGIVARFREPRRTSLAAYYRQKGAALD